MRLASTARGRPSRRRRARMVEPTLLRCIPGRDIAGDPSLDPPRSSDDAGSVWIDAPVEDEGPHRAASLHRARERPITTPESEDGRTDSPTVHLRPRYRRRSIHGPTAVERTLARSGSTHRSRMKARPRLDAPGRAGNSIGSFSTRGKSRR